MKFVLLGLELCAGAAQTVAGKVYTMKSENGNFFFYSACIAFFAAVSFVFIALLGGSRIELKWDYVLYSIAFGTAYLLSTILYVYALSTGPLALTSLFINFSLIVPTLYGIIFLGDPISYYAYIGMALLVVSLILTNKRDKNEKKANGKWVVFVIVATLANGICPVAQKMQQLKFDGAYKSEFMMVALLYVTVVMLICAFIKGGIKKDMKNSLIYGGIYGVSNAGVNYLVMVLGTLFPVAVLFPAISAGSIITTYIISRLIFKEKFTWVQNIGYAAGISSIVLLNL